MIDAASHEPIDNVKNQLLDLNSSVLEQSYKHLSPNFKRIFSHFYAELFTRHPEYKTLFSNVDIAKQETKMIHTIEVVIMSLRKPDQLLEVIKALGERHQGYGVKPEYYNSLTTTLLHVMKTFAANSWTAEVEDAWTATFQAINSIMISAYRN